VDVLVRLEERPSDSPVLAHVNSMPVLPFGTHSRRDVVTLYGDPDAQSLALALAASVESEQVEITRTGVVRHLGVWPDRGAVGDAAWRDGATGHLVTRDVDIPLTILEERARQLLDECGADLRRLTAGLKMPDWPEGTGRAITFSFSPALAGAGSGEIDLLDGLREADGMAFDLEGD
jgi:hypothetical protein